jgi:4a-hydroxytetrahydrobiopterin dehydratase
MSLLSDSEIAERLKSLPGWHYRGNGIEKLFDRGNFDGSLRFVNAVAAAANEQNHHPDISISWNHVGFVLSSHDAGGLTARDFRLATTIEKLATGS